MNDNSLGNIVDFKQRLAKKSEENDVVYECNCGCQTYYIKPNGLECSECGIFADGF